MDELIADFLAETRETLAALDVALVRLEQRPDDTATLSEIFRALHTIKGTCGFLGMPRLERVAHAGENVLGRYRDGALKVTPAGVTLILRALDAIKAIVAGIESQRGEPAGDDAALIATLEAAARGEAVEPPAADDEAARQPTPADAAPQTVRVAVDVLDNLMTLASALVLTRNQLLQVASARADPALAAPLQRLSHIVSQLQDGVVRTRMQPIGNAWAKLPRLVRDTARELGKRIELELRGAETELDRQVLELIKDPLTHMVRNSADHGLEAPAERLAAGKPEAGRIVLTARHQGGEVIVELADDGRGLDTAAIARTALVQGLVGEAALAGMTEAEIHRFIFRAGFSTAATVTAVSGRGVGMDVVRANMERVGGVVDVASRAGRGTTFAIRIPLTLAIVSALIVEVAGTRFAIPQTGVRELVRLGGGARAERIGNARVLRLRGRLLPLLSLARVLGLDAGEDGAVVVVVQGGGGAFGLIVDRLHDIEEIVVKPVSPILRHVAVFAGNTILGDGSVVMILDTAGIARAGGIGEEAEEAAVTPIATTAAETAALLLFRAGDDAPKAVPLGHVARLDEIAADRIEYAGDAMVLQYGDALLPLARIGDGVRPRHPMVVVTEATRRLGLLVDAILDVVEQPLMLDAAARPGFLGSAIVAGRATEVLDTAWWLARARAGAPAR